MPPPERTPAGAERQGPGGNEQIMRRTARETFYLLSSWPILMVAFCVVISLLATSIGLTITLVGIPLLLVTFGAARAFVHAESALQRALLNRDVDPGPYRRRRPGEGVWASALRLLSDPQTWIDVAFSLLGWIVALLTWCLTIIWTITAVVGILSPALSVFWPQNYSGLARMLTDSPVGRIMIDVGIGVVVLLTLPWVVHGLALLQSRLFGAVIEARTLQQRVVHLESSRKAAQDAEASSLHKLERDLHDGPQQRLVRLQMDLGRALHQIDQDPDKARTAMESSLTQARETLDELRNLSRGIAPPILVDRGLVAALDELTVRSAVPVAFTTNLPRDRRPDEIPARVQDATFYLVSEALTNAAKHSGAPRAEVDVQLAEGILRVVVRDEGCGGAVTPVGGGLAGLRDRLAGLDGMLDVHSPAGGPTVLTAVIPAE